MKRKPVTKTFVREECRALGARLRERGDNRLSREIDGLAAKIQSSFKDIEARLARLEPTASRPKSRKK